MRLAQLIFLVGGLGAAPVLQGQQPPAPPARDTAVGGPARTKPYQKPKVDLTRLKWMAGCWAVKLGNDQSAEEIWTDPVENLMTGVTRYFRKDHATSYDFNRIESNDSTVVMAIRNEEKPESVYTLKAIADEYVLFENADKPDFPKRIMYRLASDGSLIPRNEGDAPSSEVRMHRVKCPGGEKIRP